MAAEMLIVEDHALLAHTLAEALRAEGFRTHVVIPDTGSDVLDAAHANRPEMVLLDLHLGFRIGNGLGLIGPLTEAGMKVVVLTADDDPQQAAAAIQAGASSVVHKTRPFDELLEVVTAAGDGQPVTVQIQLDGGGSGAEGSDGFGSLTPREEEILTCLAEGKTAQAIADEFTVAVTTVRTQIASIRTKLGVPNQLAAAALALRSGWTPTEGRSPAASTP